MWGPPVPEQVQNSSHLIPVLLDIRHQQYQLMYIYVNSPDVYFICTFRYAYADALMSLLVRMYLDTHDVHIHAPTPIHGHQREVVQ